MRPNSTATRRWIGTRSVIAALGAALGLGLAAGVIAFSFLSSSVGDRERSVAIANASLAQARSQVSQKTNAYNAANSAMTKSRRFPCNLLADDWEAATGLTIGEPGQDCGSKREAADAAFETARIDLLKAKRDHEIAQSTVVRSKAELVSARSYTFVVAGVLTGATAIAGLALTLLAAWGLAWARFETIRMLVGSAIAIILGVIAGVTAGLLNFVSPGPAGQSCQLRTALGRETSCTFEAITQGLTVGLLVAVAGLLISLATVIGLRKRASSHAQLDP